MSDGDPFDQCLPKEDPELYGLLLLADQKISNVGSTLVWVILVATLGSCVALHMHWLDKVTGLDFDAGRGIGVYILICVSSFAFFSFVNGILERSAYRAMREELLGVIQRRNRSIYNLIAEIQSDEDLTNIAEQIKDDKGIHVKSRITDAIS